MSGVSDSIICPKCGENMDTYSDWKPTPYESGQCLECGYTYYTKDDQLTLKEVNEYREEGGQEPIKKLKKQNNL